MLAMISMVMIFGLDYAEVFIFPTLAVEYPAVIERYGDGLMMPSLAFTFPATGVLFLIGYVLFFSALRRQGTISSTSGWVTIAGTVLFVAGLSGVLPMFVVQAGAALFGLGLVLTGLSLQSDSS